MNDIEQQANLKITVNGKQMLIPADATVFDLLSRLELAQRGIAVEINHEIVPRDRHRQRKVEAGDWFEIVTLVGGG